MIRLLGSSFLHGNSPLVSNLAISLRGGPLEITGEAGEGGFPVRDFFSGAQALYDFFFRKFCNSSRDLHKILNQ